LKGMDTKPAKIKLKKLKKITKLKGWENMTFFFQQFDINQSF
jgi:hypothetical protein